MSGNRSKSTFFEGRWVTLNTDFRGKRASPTNHSWYQSSRVIALSCGIKISAVRHLVLSQSTRVTDGQTDGWTDRRTDRENCDSQDRPRICSRGKNVAWICRAWGETVTDLQILGRELHQNASWWLGFDQTRWGSYSTPQAL